MYKISEIAKAKNIPISTLRYYEKLGILRPQRSNLGYREYTAIDLEWIAFIQRLKKTGMDLTDIKHYSDLRHAGKSTIPERLQMLDEQKAQLLSKKKQLEEDLCFIENKQSIYRQMIKEDESQTKKYQK